jgi:hypothetical protein
MIRVIVIISLLATTFRCHAQRAQAGIYSKAEDVFNNHFAFKFSCDSGKVRVALGKTINIYQKKASRSFSYSEVYGYRNCDKKTFGILNRKEYEIINTEEIILYKTENIISKSSELEQQYFFSPTLEAPLFTLTIQNLNATYYKSQQVHDLLVEHFKSDEELIRFNKSLGKYEIVHILLDAKKR